MPLTRPDLSSALSPERLCHCSLGSLAGCPTAEEKKREDKTSALPRQGEWLSVTMGTPPLRGPIRDDSTSPRAGGCVSGMARGRRPRGSRKDLHSQLLQKAWARAAPEQVDPRGTSQGWQNSGLLQKAFLQHLCLLPPVYLEVGRTRDPAPWLPTSFRSHQPGTLSPSILLSKPNRVHLGAPAARARR